MNKDQCILVDEHDTITGQASKKDVHVFDQKTPTGQLHRAFSVFLFNSQVIPVSKPCCLSSTFWAPSV